MFGLLTRSAPVAGETALLAEAQENVDAVTAMVTTLAEASTVPKAISSALELVRGRFGWAYGSHWHIDEDGTALVFAQDSGEVGEEFRRITLAASFREGVGLSGRAWKTRELVFVADSASCVTVFEPRQPSESGSDPASASP